MASVLDTVSQGVSQVFSGGKLVEDAVTLRIGVNAYESFEDMTITQSLDTLSSAFEISFADKWRQSQGQWPLKPGQLVRGYIGTTSIINGFIDRLDVSVTNEDRTLTINGRDKTADLIDCSAGVNTQTQFKNAKIDTIAKSYASLYGITVKTNADVGEAFKKVSPEQDESVFEFLSRLAKERGLLLISDLSGNLVITNRAGSSAALPSVKNPVASFDFKSAIKNLVGAGTDLIQGENILSASATYDDSDRFQQYVVKGQSKGTDTFSGLAVTQVTSAAIDPGILRFRPKVLMAENQVSIKTAQQRAGWEAIVRAAQAVDIRVTIQGWRKADGSLWAPNELINLDAGFIGISPQDQFLISSVEFKKSKREGTLTTFGLTRADAYVANPLINPTKDTKAKLGWETTVLGQARNLLGR